MHKVISNLRRNVKNLTLDISVSTEIFHILFFESKICRINNAVGKCALRLPLQLLGECFSFNLCLCQFFSHLTTCFPLSFSFCHLRSCLQSESTGNATTSFQKFAMKNSSLPLTCSQWCPSELSFEFKNILTRWKLLFLFILGLYVSLGIKKQNNIQLKIVLTFIFLQNT